MSSMMTASVVGALGSNVLRRFRVELDYASGKVYLSPQLPEDFRLAD